MKTSRAADYWPTTSATAHPDFSPSAPRPRGRSKLVLALMIVLLAIGAALIGGEDATPQFTDSNTVSSSPGPQTWD